MFQKLAFLIFLASLTAVNSHGMLRIPKPREEPGSRDWHYCRFVVNQYYVRSKLEDINKLI